MLFLYHRGRSLALKVVHIGQIAHDEPEGGAPVSYTHLDVYKRQAQRSEEKTRKALAQFLRPEFLGRVDEVIAFKPLTEQTLQGIAALMLDEYKPGMEAKGIAYSYTPAALKRCV